MQAFNNLIETVAKLRAPDGCPWDKEQTHVSLKPYLIEEAYEVLEAIDSQNPDVLQDELGDLLLQVVLHAQIAAEKKEFSITEVINSIDSKLIRRHPHVFADTKVKNVKDVWQNWEQIKKTEKKPEKQKSVLDSIPKALPALYRSTKVQKKAARLGFDWPDSNGPLEKIKEEIQEFETDLKNNDKEKMIDEFGDILFSLVNLSRKLDFDSEDALRLATNKFEKRFKYIEESVNTAGKKFSDYSLEELDEIWNKSKKNEQ